jgi:hypothetical protein
MSEVKVPKTTVTIETEAMPDVTITLEVTGSVDGFDLRKILKFVLASIAEG